MQLIKVPMGKLEKGGEVIFEEAMTKNFPG